jgi:hypothetical protein
MFCILFVGRRKKKKEREVAGDFLSRARGQTHLVVFAR